MTPEARLDGWDQFPDLLGALRRGDNGAWERILTRLQPRVAAAIRARFGVTAARPDQRGGEALDSAVGSLFRHLRLGDYPDLGSEAELTNLFVAIAVRKCCNRVRKERRLLTETDCAGWDAPVAEPAAPWGAPDDALAAAEVLREVHDALDTMRRRLRQEAPAYVPLVEAKIRSVLGEREHSDDDIAARHHCSRATVTRAWRRARDLLRELLADAAPDATTAAE